MAGERNVISIEVTADTEQAQESIDKLANSTGNLGKAAGPTDKALDDLSDGIDGVKNVSVPAGESIGGLSAALLGWAGVIAVALPVIIGLGAKIFEVVEESERLNNISNRLDLPTDKVKDYAEEWLGVAISLNEAARGFETLDAAQTKAFAALGIFSGGTGAGDAALTRVAAMTGTEAEKVDVLRILTGLSEEDARKSLNKELDRLATFTSTKNVRRTTVANAEGVVFGAENAGDLLRSNAIVPGARLKEMEQGRKDLESIRKARIDGEKQALADIKKLEDDAGARRMAAAMERQRKLIQNWQDQLSAAGDIASLLIDDQDFEKLGKQLQQEAEYANDLADSIKDISLAGGDALADLARDSEKSIALIRGPFDELIDAFKQAGDALVRTGDFSGKQFVNQLIAALLQKRLYDAIDKLGDALSSALSGGSSGGGFLGKVGGFIGGLFAGGGKAGGGIIDKPTLVGEEGPEIAFPGRGGASIANLRQIGFAGGGQSRGELVYAPVNHYSLSGVETQALIAYIEEGQKNTQQGFLKMLYNNGFGRMR